MCPGRYKSPVCVPSLGDSVLLVILTVPGYHVPRLRRWGKPRWAVHRSFAVSQRR
jgi:hypothetical protein